MKPATCSQTVHFVCITRRFCSQPTAAVKLLACMAAVWSVSQCDRAEGLLSAYSVQVAFTAMPYSLPKLLSQELWQACSSIVSEELLNILLDRTGHFNSRFHTEVDGVVCLPCVQYQLHTSVVVPDGKLGLTSHYDFCGCSNRHGRCANYLCMLYTC